MSKLVIFGAGDIAKLAHFYFSNDSDHEVVAFTVHEKYLVKDTFCGLSVIPFESVRDIAPPSEHSMFVALSYAKMNSIRTSVCSQAKEHGYQLESYISSRCTVLTDATFGENCFILEDNTIQPFTQIGSNVTLWSGNHIGHDSVIEDNCFITSHVVVSGNCTIKNSCFIGVNATLRNSITVGERSLIGAGAVIMKDTPAESVWIPERTKIFSKKSSQIDI